MRFDGVDFSKFRNLRKEVKTKKFSVKLLGVKAQDTVARLAFASGKQLRIRKGDPGRVISLSIQDATLNEILNRIEGAADVKISR